MRILSLDVGEKTIGVAVSDPLGLTARPLETIRRQSKDADMARLEDLVSGQGVELILVGLALLPSGEAGDSAQRALRLARRIRARMGCPVLAVDERHSTWEANELLREGGLGRRAKERWDDNAVAAALILKRYLEEGNAVVLERYE